MPGGHHLAGFLAMAWLVIEEHIGRKGLEKGCLVQATKEQRLIEANIPFAQGANDPLMGWSRTRGNQGRADRAKVLGKLPLQAIQSIEEGLKGPPPSNSRAEAFS